MSSRASHPGPALGSSARRAALRRVFFLAVLGVFSVLVTAPASELVRLPMVAAGGLEARSAALILSGQEGGEVALEVIPLPLPDDSLVLWLRIDPADLPAPVVGGQEDGSPWLLELHVYALGPGDEVLFASSRAKAIDSGLRAAISPGGAMHAVLRLELPETPEPGQTLSLRTLLLERRSERFGLRVDELTWPRWRGADTGGTGSSSVLLPPLALTEPGTGLLLLGDDGPVPFPHGLDGRLWVPRRPWLGAAGSPPLLVLGRGLGQQIDFHLLALSGEELASHRGAAYEPGPVGPGTPGIPHGLELRTLRVPELGLAPGSYRLRLETGGRGVEQVVRQVRQVRATDETPVDGEKIAEPRQASSDARRLADSYLRALAPLARGEVEAAQRAVTELERRALAQADRALPLLAVEMAAIEELSGDDPRSLVPLMVLHEALYRQSHRAGDFRRSTHSRILLAGLVERLLTARDDDETRLLVADLLASQGAYLLAIGSTLSARNALRSALEHVPSHPEALLLMAAIEEALGDHDAAVRGLETLVEREPSPEAFLRLAINRYRLGEVESAEELLRQCLGSWDESEPARRVETPEDPPEWVMVVAHQELARLLLAEGRDEEGLAVLELATRRFGHQPRAVLQYAAALEQRGRIEESRRLLRGLTSEGRGAHDTPRLVYSRWPLWVVDRIRRRLVERQREGMASFETALTAVSPGGEVMP